MDLNERKKRILKSIIDTYITSGEPVGSKYLSDNMGLNVSPATIRNEMSELERLGLLRQPHTSAGRVPSSDGYRVYVENLMNEYYLSLDEISVLNELLTSKVKHFDRVVSDVTKVLSEMTDYTAFAYTAKPVVGRIKRFDGVLLSENVFLLVTITSNDNVKTRKIKSRFPINQRTLSQIIDILNDSLKGLSFEEIDRERVYDLQMRLGSLSDIVNDVMSALSDALHDDDGCEVYLDGMSNLLKYPDFSDIEKTRSVLSILEEKDVLIRMISENSGDRDGLNILIGDERLDRGLDSTSFVYHKFNIGDNMTGVLGLIGPRRMNYSEVIARLEYVVRNLLGDSEQNSKG